VVRVAQLSVEGLAQVILLSVSPVFCWLAWADCEMLSQHLGRIID
jgi:hypothetical protein